MIAQNDCSAEKKIMSDRVAIIYLKGVTSICGQVTPMFIRNQCFFLAKLRIIDASLFFFSTKRECLIFLFFFCCLRVRFSFFFIRNILVARSMMPNLLIGSFSGLVAYLV